MCANFHRGREISWLSKPHGRLVVSHRALCFCAFCSRALGPGFRVHLLLAVFPSCSLLSGLSVSLTDMNVAKTMPGFLLALGFWEPGEFSAYHPGGTWLPGFASQHWARSQLCVLGQVTQPLCASAAPELFSKVRRHPHGLLSWNYHEDQKKGAQCLALSLINVFSAACYFRLLTSSPASWLSWLHHPAWCLWGSCWQCPHDPSDLTPFSEPGKGASATWLRSHGLGATELGSGWPRPEPWAALPPRFPFLGLPASLGLAWNQVPARPVRGRTVSSRRPVLISHQESWLAPCPLRSSPGGFTVVTASRCSKALAF